MPRTLALTLAFGVAMGILAGCAHDPKPAICDGKHRRPANLYGSVLPSIPGADPATPPAGPSPPTIAPPLGPESSIDPETFAPCGART